MTFTPEQELYLIKQQIAAQQSAPSGAITANGIVKYQTIIIFMIMSAVGVAGWLVLNSVNGATKMTNIERDIAELQRIVGNMTKSPNDVFSLPPRMAAVEERQKEQDKVLIEINKTLGGLPQQFLNLSTDIRNLRDKGGR